MSNSLLLTKKNLALFLLILLSISCVSTKSTLKNVDDNAPIPKITKDNTFVLTEYSTDKKYGYDKDYPINVFFHNSPYQVVNQERFLNALTGPKGEPIHFNKLESCCPFPSKRTGLGAGFLDIYEITWEGLNKPIKLYLNGYEKGLLKVPVGFGLKK